MKTGLSIFPKSFAHVALDDLGPMLRDIGLDRVNLVVREGFWCDAGNLRESVPRFRAAMERAGLAVDFCTWTLDPERLPEETESLRILADNGIRQMRIGYFHIVPGSSYAEQIRAARDTLRRAIPTLEDLGMRAVYQVHHGTLVASPEGAAVLVEGLPVERLGVMLDAGNQGFEGGANWKRAAAILGEHWTALGVKDYLRRPRGEPGDMDKGSAVEFASCAEGMTDWTEVRKAWNAAARPGHWVLQPFYCPDDFQKFLATLRDEVAFIQRILDA